MQPESKRLILQSLLLLFASFLCYLLYDFNPIILKYSNCSLYQYNSNCLPYSHYAANKVLRWMLNIILLFIADKIQLKLFSKKVKISIAVITFFLLLIDLFLSTQNQLFLQRMHNILSTVLYSPLILLVYLVNTARLKLL